MSLKKYQKKRDFRVSHEPKGAKKIAKKYHNMFLIQKHAASHLHYDFRLELNGVLLSWAVPKGPSLDPAVKRLAMHVEDHPVEYGSFEGIIPKGQYGGGTVMLWDKGTWHCEEPNPMAAYHQGNLSFTLTAKKLQGHWKLIRMHNDDKTWLLMKIKDEYAKSSKRYDITIAEPNSVVSHLTMEEIAEKNGQPIIKKKTNRLDPIMPLEHSASSMPKTIYPQLATLVDKPPIGKNWVHEIKFDGYRLIAFKKNKIVTLYTRNQHDWTEKFTKVAQAVNKLSTKNFILDGEIVVLDDKQHSNFQLLQNALKQKKAPFIYYVFDLLYYDKYDLMDTPLNERKQLLKEILDHSSSDILRYSDHATSPGLEVYTHACQLGLEGIISKDITSTYSQTRDKKWLKIKCIKRQEFVIGGYLPSSRRQYFRSLMLGTFNDKHELIYNGNVGTGFTASSLKSVQALLKKHQTNQMPFAKLPRASKNAIWVEPVIIAEIEFTEWTDDDSLRHPSFKGLRSDKLAKNVIKEVPLSVTTITSKAKKSNEKKSGYILSHPDKEFYPESNITKMDVAEYYDAIHEWILPYIINRPISLVRCPENYKKCFFQKHISGEVPAGLYQKNIRGKNSDDLYYYIKNHKGLMSLVQLNALEIHPWSSVINKLEYPDFITFDIDPDENISWKKVVTAALDVKKALSELNLTCFVKTTGGKGLHVVAPIKPRYDWDQIKQFTHTLVNYLVMTHPSVYTDNMSKLKRKNKIFIDYLRNQRGATTISPYSTRARKGAPVATPLAWDELTNDRRDTAFTIETVVKRLDNLKADPWKDFFTIKQQIKIDGL